MTSLPVNPADLIVAGVILLSGLVALARGFVREVLSLLGWAGAALVTLWGFSPLQPYARTWIDHNLIADLATGLALFIVSLVVFSLISRGLAGFVRRSALSALDRSLGFAFGLVRGAALVALAYLALGWTMPPAEHPDWILKARSLPLVVAGAELLRSLAPPEFRGQAIGEPGRGQTRQDAERALRALTGSAPKAPTPGGESGYKVEERRELERLLQSAQPPPSGQPGR
ncbi:MAG: CvpA family protein [Pseudomonadota bacterium]